MRLIDATGGVCPEMVIGYARARYNQISGSAVRPSKRTDAFPLPDSASDLFVITITFGRDPATDSILVVNGNPFRITAAIDNTVYWSGGIAPFTVAVQVYGNVVDTETPATGTFVNVDMDIYTIASGVAREFTVMKAHELDATDDDNDYYLGWWAADDVLIDGNATQRNVGVIIVDSSTPPREIFAPFGGLTRGGNVIYEHFGPESWTYAHLHWTPPVNMVYGDALTVGVQLNATAHVPDAGLAALPGTFNYWMDDDHTIPAENVVPPASVGLPLFVSFQADDTIHYHLTYGHHHQGHGDGEIPIAKKDQFFVNGNIPYGFFYPGSTFDCVIYDYHFSGLPLNIFTTTPDTLATSNIRVSYDDPTPAHSTWPAAHFTVTCLAEGMAVLVEQLEGDNNYNPYAKTFSWQVVHKASFTGDGGAIVAGAATIIMEVCHVGSGGAVAGGEAIQIKDNCYIGDGGAVVGGTSINSCEAIFTGDGGAVVGGSSTIHSNTRFDGHGGAVVSGTAAWFLSKEIRFIGSGGAIVGGAAETSVMQFKVAIGTGGAVVGGTAIVTRKETPTIIWPDPAPITYGTALSSDQLNATAKLGIFTVPGTFVYSPAAGTVPDANSGLPLYVTFTPDDSSRYNSVADWAGLVVNKAPQYINGYLGDSTLSTGQSTEIVITASGQSGNAVTYSSLNPGIASISGTTVTAVSTGACWIIASQAGNTNYEAGSFSMYCDVGKATPIITWNDPAPITYGTALSATQLNATANVAGTFSYSPAAGTVPGANTGLVLSVTFTPSDSSNYEVVSDWAGIVVNKANQTISAFTLEDIGWEFETGKWYIYIAEYISATSGLPVELISLTPTVGYAGTGAYAGGFIAIANGTLVVEARQSGNANYNAATPVTASCVINHTVAPPVTYPPFGYTETIEWQPAPGANSATATVHLNGWTQYGLGITFDLISISGETTHSAEPDNVRVTGQSATWLQSPSFTVTGNQGANIVITYRVLNDAGTYSGNYTITVTIPVMHWAPSMASICLESYLSNAFISWCINGNTKEYLVHEDMAADACDGYYNGWTSSALNNYINAGTMACGVSGFPAEYIAYPGGGGYWSYPFYYIYKEEVWTKS